MHAIKVSLQLFQFLLVITQIGVFPLLCARWHTKKEPFIIVMPAIFSVAVYSFRQQRRFSFELLINLVTPFKQCSVRQSSENRLETKKIRRHQWFCHSRGSTVECQFGLSSAEENSQMCFICRTRTFSLHCVGCLVCLYVVMRVLCSGIYIRTCLHSAQDQNQPITKEICMQGVSPMPLKAARQAVPRTSCLDWHPHLLCRLPPSFPSLSMAPLFYSAHITVRERAT